MSTGETHLSPVTADELHQLANHLEHLITHHRQALEEEGVLDDVETLQRWIESCQGGSKSAERKLYQDGVTLLETIKQKLTLAMQEEQRMIEESPAAAVSAKGRHAERLAQATSNAHDALHSLTQISGELTEEEKMLKKAGAK